MLLVVFWCFYPEKEMLGFISNTNHLIQGSYTFCFKEVIIVKLPCILSYSFICAVFMHDSMNFFFFSPHQILLKDLFHLFLYGDYSDRTGPNWHVMY